VAGIQAFWKDHKHGHHGASISRRRVRPGGRRGR
jgi:hypothetical protein